MHCIGFTRKRLIVIMDFLLCLRESYKALQLPVSFFFSFFSFFYQPYPEYRGIRNKKKFTANTIQLFVPQKKKMFVRRSSSEGKKTCLNFVKILTSEQIALAVLVTLDKFLFSAGYSTKTC